jgi:hypothetical protein
VGERALVYENTAGSSIVAFALSYLVVTAQLVGENSQAKINTDLRNGLGLLRLSVIRRRNRLFADGRLR